MPARRSHIVRATALVLATGVNVLFLFLLSSHRQVATPEPAVSAMIWMVAATEQLPPVRRSVRPRARPREMPPVPELVPSVTVSLEPGIAREAPAPVVPQVDWDAASDKAVRDMLRAEQQQRELESHMHSLNSMPQVLVIPPRKHKRGDKDDLGDGAYKEWFNDRCFSFHEPGFPLLEFCEPPRNLSAERAAALEEAVKPRYLGGKRPVPEEPDSRIKIP